VGVEVEEGLKEKEIPVVTSVRLDQDELEVEEELKFAVGVLLQEIQSIRDAACAQWINYKNNEIDLIVAAMTSNTSIRLVQKAEAEFDLVVKRPKKYPQTPVQSGLDLTCSASLITKALRPPTLISRSASILFNSPSRVSSII
jgi:hypothetical protein